MASDRDGIATQRLDSWKEIAAFFGRAERTVRRWEADRGLPVHRLPGSSRSAVFAYAHELSDWLQGQTPESEPVMLPGETNPADPRIAPTVKDRTMAIPVLIEAKLQPRPRIFLWTAILLAVSAIFAAALFYRVRHSASANDRISNREAQELYLKGRYFWDRRTPDDLNKAIDYFTQAIVKDPAAAQAYVGLADCYNLLSEFGAMSASEAYPRALAAAQRAVELDDSSAEAHNSLAFPTFWWSWKGASAEREFKRALQLNPNLARGHHWYATYLLATPRKNEALVQIEQAQKLEPSSTAILADKGYILWSLGRHAEALALLKQLESSEPELSSTHYYLGIIDWDQQDYFGAVAEWKQVAEQRHDDSGVKIADASAQGLSSGGLRGLLERKLPLEKELVDRGGGSAYDLAAIYAALGKKEEALVYLQLAFDRREADMLVGDPPIPQMRDDPAYQKLRDRITAMLAQ